MGKIRRARVIRSCYFGGIMRIVILMGGLGSRFSAVGYRKPKPLLRVDGKTMVEHVVSLYPGNHEFIFVCNEGFIDNAVLRTLKKNLPDSRIVPVSSHKLGPVHSLSVVWDELPANEPALVSYCDFKAHWNFADFEKRVRAREIDGAVPCYTGFHPHLLHEKKYAGVLAGRNGMMKKIQEKHCFTSSPKDSFHSAGNYYFSRADDMRRYGRALIESGERINGEMYLSMVYYHYLADGRRILVYPLEHFLQWGTPEDLEEYEAWSSLLGGRNKGVTDIPASRRKHVIIPYKDDSRAYKQSFRYWKSYFSK